ncbi:hypothetical protein GGI15_000221 [Coemansia interrupta]|uniref:Uncharacterized protein n=1 Tax=Coemansia interrupta TaxID=1126814 RepID=A0A9W8HKI2_9FUNG|nr:hypothetical protein GGI15_000221 [Coemansia interrupta]
MFIGTYTKLIFLGDSNSDNGNVFRLTENTHPSPPEVYWNGRYSDGKTWTDHLSTFSNDQSLNLAYGCATIDNSLVSGTVPMPDGSRMEVPSIADQVAQLRSLAGHLNPSDLAFIQVGSNDLNSLVHPGPTYRIKRAFTPETLARRLAESVKTLCVDLGASNVVVMNVRPREQYPGILATGDPAIIQKSLSDTVALNQAIASEMAMLQDTLGDQCRIMVFDTYSFQKSITLNPAAAGIDPEWQVPVYSEPRSEADSAILSDSKPKLFVDAAHLGKRAQTLLAAEVVKMLILNNA